MGLSTYDFNSISIFGGHLLPPSDNAYDLGSAARSWRNLHVQTAVVGTTVTGNWLPSADNTYDLGENSTPLEWKDLYIDGTAYLDNMSVPDGFTITSETSAYSYLDHDNAAWDFFTKTSGAAAVSRLRIPTGTDSVDIAMANANLLFGSGYGIRANAANGTIVDFEAYENGAYVTLLNMNSSATTANFTVHRLTTFDDDILFRLGTTGDQVLVNRSTTLAANTTLSNVLVGTPVTSALAANSLIMSNITSDGDMMFVVNDGGNSKGLIFLDGSAGTTHFTGNTEVDGTIFIDAGAQIRGSAGLICQDDRGFYQGTNSDALMIYETADANALMLQWGLPHVAENASNVAVLALMDRDAVGADLGAAGIDLSGTTSPTLVLCAEDQAGYVGFSCTDADIWKIIGTTSPVVEVDESKFSHKLQVDINGSTYYIMLTAT